MFYKYVCPHYYYKGSSHSLFIKASWIVFHVNLTPTLPFRHDRSQAKKDEEINNIGMGSQSGSGEGE